jgi:hypothetical protein
VGRLKAMAEPQKKLDYDSTTVAWIAGSIAGNLLALYCDPSDMARYRESTTERIAKDAVAIARAIVAETRNTQPAEAAK